IEAPIAGSRGKEDTANPAAKMIEVVVRENRARVERGHEMEFVRGHPYEVRVVEQVLDGRAGDVIIKLQLEKSTAPWGDKKVGRSAGGNAVAFRILNVAYGQPIVRVARKQD